jgi:uroporphyrinogen III methyltransferase/synthase
VVVTRTRAQASSLVSRLTALGATVVELPVIAVEDASDGGTGLQAAADRLVGGAYGWVALTSTNATSRLLEAVGRRRLPPTVRWAAVGPGTAAALVDGGVHPDLVPTGSAASTSDGLAQAFPAVAERGGGVAEGVTRDAAGGAPAPGPLPVLFPRAETVRGELVAGLEAKGWTVDQVVAYRTVAGAPDASALAQAAEADAVAFTSSSTVDRTVELLGLPSVPPVIATIGPTTSASVRTAGLRVTVEATHPTIDGLVAALVEALGAH